jgi:hypothetical protein
MQMKAKKHGIERFGHMMDIAEYVSEMFDK